MTDIQFSNPLQVRIAEMIWNAGTREEVIGLVDQYGYDGRVVHSMILATALDEVMSTSKADSLWKKLVQKWSE